MSINLLIKHKAYDALEDYVRENEPLVYSNISDIPYDEKFLSFVTQLRSEDPLYMVNIVKYRNIRDIYYTDVILTPIDEKDSKTFYREAKVLIKCIRGHFHMDTDRMLHWYLYFIFCLMLDRREIRYKYDWVLSSPGNIIHIREKYIWIKNSTSISYKIMLSLLKNYRQVMSIVPRILVKLDNHAMEFIKNITGEDLTCLKYGVMDRSLFETIISEHVRMNTTHSPNVLRWMSHYNIGMKASPNVILKYISTLNSSEIYQSPIYQSDLNDERHTLITSSTN
jgi:hypothetical protein